MHIYYIIVTGENSISPTVDNTEVVIGLDGCDIIFKNKTRIVYTLLEMRIHRMILLLHGYYY